MSMSAIDLSTQNADIDAAQALLDLRGPYVWHGTDREDNENTAKLFWNCFIASDVPVVPNNNHLEPNMNMSPADFPTIPISFDSNSRNIKMELEHSENVSRRYKSCDQSSSRNVDSITKSSHKLPHLENYKQMDVKNINKGNRTQALEVKTREIGTQTEERYFNPNIELMDTTIKSLCERIKLLEAQLKESDVPLENSGYISSENNEHMQHDQSYASQSNDSRMSLKEDPNNECNMNQYMKYSSRIQYEDHFRQREENVEKKRALTNHNTYSNSSDLVPIGEGHATVSARILKHINWNSYTSATRKLLTAVFSRRILATHSLTGKPSPAFPNKPAKKKLDAALVNDIVQTVVERCSVPGNVVRTSITTKCADESKMFRTRQTNKTRRISKKHRENFPPTTSESESDSY